MKIAKHKFMMVAGHNKNLGSSVEGFGAAKRETNPVDFILYRVLRGCTSIKGFVSFASCARCSVRILKRIPTT